MCLPSWMRLGPLEKSVVRLKHRIYARLYDTNTDIIDVFHALDSSGKGELTLHEFGAGLRELGIESTPETVAELWAELDTANNGRVDFREMIIAFKRDAETYVDRLQLIEALQKLVLFTFVGVPSVMITVAAVFGTMLSYAEDWPWIDCFMILIQEILQVEGFVLVSGKDFRPGPLGKMVAIVICTWELAFFGLILAVMAGPILLPIFQKFNLTLTQSEMNFKTGRKDDLDNKLLDDVGISHDPRTVNRMMAGWVYQIRQSVVDNRLYRRTSRDLSDESPRGSQDSDDPGPLRVIPVWKDLNDVRDRLDDLTNIVASLSRKLDNLSAFPPQQRDSRKEEEEEEEEQKEPEHQPHSATETDRILDGTTPVRRAAQGNQRRPGGTKPTPLDLYLCSTDTVIDVEDKTA